MSPLFYAVDASESFDDAKVRKIFDICKFSTTKKHFLVDFSKGFRKKNYKKIWECQIFFVPLQTN